MLYNWTVLLKKNYCDLLTKCTVFNILGRLPMEIIRFLPRGYMFIPTQLNFLGQVCIEGIHNTPIVARKTCHGWVNKTVPQRLWSANMLDK